MDTTAEKQAELAQGCQKAHNSILDTLGLIHDAAWRFDGILSRLVCFPSDDMETDLEATLCVVREIGQRMKEQAEQGLKNALEDINRLRAELA
jgi:hypothetical protein